MNLPALQPHVSPPSAQRHSRSCRISCLKNKYYTSDAWIILLMRTFCFCAPLNLCCCGKNKWILSCCVLVVLNRTVQMRDVCLSLSVSSRTCLTPLSCRDVALSRLSHSFRPSLSLSLSLHDGVLAFEDSLKQKCTLISKWTLQRSISGIVVKKSVWKQKIKLFQMISLILSHL